MREYALFLLQVAVHNVGQGTVTLLDHGGEEYVATFPSGFCRSILTVPWVELGGQSGHRVCQDRLLSFHRVQVQAILQLRCQQGKTAADASAMGKLHHLNFAPQIAIPLTANCAREIRY